MMLQDKVCLVVGAASLRGIGYATAELFARHGAKLAVVDVAMDDKTTAAIAVSITAAIGRAPTIIGLKCDIQSASECKQVVAETVKQLGGLECKRRRQSPSVKQPSRSVAPE